MKWSANTQRSARIAAHEDIENYKAHVMRDLSNDLVSVFVSVTASLGVCSPNMESRKWRHYS